MRHVLCASASILPLAASPRGTTPRSSGAAVFARLQQTEVVELPSEGFEDDAAVAAGIGFTDVVKRPTPHADQLTTAEKRRGVDLLAEKLGRLRRRSSSSLSKRLPLNWSVGSKATAGLRREFAGSRLFVMPGPCERAATAALTLASLRSGVC